MGPCPAHDADAVTAGRLASVPIVTEPARHFGARVDVLPQTVCRVLDIVWCISRETFMKKLSLALAVAAALSTVVVPIAPASAATAVARTASHGALANHAERGNAIILSQTQLNGLARSNPQLHAKLMAAYRTNSIPQLSKGEKRTVQAITQKNM